HRYIADAELQRAKKRMRPDVPPNLLCVIDAIGLNQQVHEILELRPARISIRNIRARKLVEYLASVGFQASLHSLPEWRVGRKREQMRQKVARLIHDVNRSFAIFDADVHVKSKDEIGASDELQVFDNFQIALIRIYLL